MDNVKFKFNFSELKLDISQIERILGNQGEEKQEIITDIISNVLKEFGALLNIKAEYIVFRNVKFNDLQKSVEINNLVFQINRIVFRQLKKSDSVAVFLCTAGEEIGLRSRQAMKDGDLLRGYVYDVIGSEIVEATADLMEEALKKETEREGKKITNRLSPGYCSWDVAEQHKLFTLVPGNYCGIRLTESALMDPVKSASGFIGIGEDVKRYLHSCDICDMKNCYYREVRTMKGITV